MRKITLFDLAYLSRELDNQIRWWLEQNQSRPPLIVATSEAVHATANNLYRISNELGGEPQGKTTRHAKALEVLQFDGSEADAKVLRWFRDLPPWESP